MSETAAEQGTAEVVDLAFALRGESIQPDYSLLLRQSVARGLDWFEGEPRAGIHPIRGATESGDRLVLSRRAQLVLRLPLHRVGQGRRLTGARFDLGGPVEVGEAALRPLQPYPVLYSGFVSTGFDDEARFLAEAQRLVAAAGIECKLIVGKRRRAQGGDGPVTGYSLMLHGLSAEHSLRIQTAGLGGQHLLGCGIFVPHKSIAAVGG
jgi:CRISPR-associated protein Cas6